MKNKCIQIGKAQRISYKEG